MTPAISVVVAADTGESIARLLSALRAQTIRESVELVIVCPSGSALGLGVADTAGIGQVRVVEVGTVVPLDPAVAEGIHASAAPVVVVGETHAFPAPDALETALAFFVDDAVAAVVPGLENANPGPLSWASLMVTYGRALGSEPREVAAISTHNATMRRAPLVALGDELPLRLTFGGELGEALRRSGWRLLYRPEVRFQHLNVARLGSCLRDRFHGGRCYAAARSSNWRRRRRALYLIGTPFIPALVGWRIVRSEGWRQYRAELDWRTWPFVALSVVAGVSGEMAAYARGPGLSFERAAEFELRRERHI